MSEPLFGVYGASGFGREVMPLAREQLRRGGGNPRRLVFIDDGMDTAMLNGQPVVRYEAFLKIAATSRFVAIAIANGTVRKALSERCAIDGVLPWDVSAANVVSLDEVTIGEGAILCPFVTLTSNIHIGRQFHANLYSYVAHDCRIGDWVTFAPGVKCNGNVIVEDHAYVGTGAVIKQGRPGQPLIVGRGAVIGMGAVVTKNVPPGVTVVGNPARIMTKE